jgi:hypothetical protein
MIYAGISELKNKVSRYIYYVKGGETVGDFPPGAALSIVSRSTSKNKQKAKAPNKRQGGLPPEKPPSTRNPARWSNRRKIFVALFLGIATTIGGITGYVELQPNVQVAPWGIPTNNNDVFSQMFQIHNAGYLSLYDVMYSCRFLSGELGGSTHNAYIGHYDPTPHFLAFELGHGIPATINCDINITSDLSHINLAVVIYYRSVITPELHIDPRTFTLVKAADKGWQWAPEPTPHSIQ